ncbi:MAG TPA: hypothetical protein DCW91_02550 [Acinetobacter nosocomialis]|nr:hypothetical protein [Acinetobacter nosocomialis]
MLPAMAPFLSDSKSARPSIIVRIEPLALTLWMPPAAGHSVSETARCKLATLVNIKDNESGLRLSKAFFSAAIARHWSMF